MASLSGFPFFETAFDREGRPVDPGAQEELLEHLSRAAPDDVLVLSHGWNNDMAEARRLYQGLAGSLRRVLGAGEGVTLVGVFWPSKKFADRDLIPGGAAALGGGGDDARLEEELVDLRGVFDAPDADALLETARRAASGLEHDPEARRRFVEAMRGLLDGIEGGGPPDAEDRAAAEGIRTTPAEVLLSRASDLDDEAMPAPGGGAAGMGAGGGAAGLGDLLGGLTRGARRLLNLVTYYQMKERAGLVGAAGVADLLRGIRAAAPSAGLHLVGHSFGGRLVTAAAAASEAGAIDSMTLLQAAFSHYGFARNYRGTGRDGAFRTVVEEGKVRGPILVTHTANDDAVGRAYPVASRIARQAASGLGDRGDLYGGIGRNGALDAPEVVDGGELLDVGGAYPFRERPQRIFNLESTRFIADHGDVAGPEVAWALLEAVKCRRPGAASPDGEGAAPAAPPTPGREGAGPARR